MRDWRSDDNYSIGQLVAPAALFLVWTRRKKLGLVALRPCWWGALVIILALTVRLYYGFGLMYESAERYALWLTIVGAILLIGGTELTRRLIWILAFLLLMIPFPGRLHNAISAPLQNLATTGAAGTLEVLGYRVVQEGNVLAFGGDMSVTVAEACSGLRMLTAFIVVSAVLAFLMNRPVWHKAVVLLSSVPVAIFCNLIRLVATAVIFSIAGKEFAEKFFHDFAGIFMMPVAVVMLAVEIWVLSKLEVSHDDV